MRSAVSRFRCCAWSAYWLCIYLCAQALAGEVPVVKTPAPPGTYLNPIGDPPIHLQDPFILAYAKKYYLFGTASPSEGFHCYESTDLVHWKFDGWAWRRGGLRVAMGDLHGPEVFLYQGMFCLVYSGRMANRTQLALAASTKPEGPYHDLHAPWLPLGDACSDGDVFVDANGKAYLTYSQRSMRNSCNYGAIYGVALNKDLSKTIGESVKLLEANQRWELVHRERTQYNVAPFLFKIRSKYYLIYSANDPLSSDCGTGYATADKPLGPWTKGLDNPLLSTRPDIGVVGPGGAAIFRSLDQSEWFMVYHTFADPAQPSDDHVVNIDRLLLQESRKLEVKGPTRSPQALPSSAK